MASRDESDTRSEDNNLWPQIPFWGPDHEPADRNTYPQIDAFSLLSIMTPHRSQPHPTEPGPFFHSWDNTLPAQVLTQRKAHALAICGCAEQLTNSRWTWTRPRPMGVRGA
jgi:hypothetical protein